MSRQSWDSLGVRPGIAVPIDVMTTPMAGISSNASVVATVAAQYSNATAEIQVVRWDEKDAPTPYNLDRYSVWVDLSSHRSFPQMLAAASTEDNPNLRKYLAETVFIVKQDPGPDHWSATIPTTIAAVVQPRSSSRTS